MTPEELQNIVKAGSTARASGIGFFDNPYLKNVAEYSAAGKLEEWTVKYECWKSGWEIENLIRSKCS
jgi:hypothetical protein